MNGFDWDDVRFFLALARCGTLSGAAQVLGVSHVTVARRIRGMAERVGRPMFDKTPSGFVLTSFGEELLGAAESVEAAALHMVRVADAHDEAIAGRVRLAVGGFMSLFFCMPLVKELSEAHPNLSLELIESSAMADLQRHEADLAIRILTTDDFPVPETLVARKLGRMEWAYFASDALVEETGVDSLGDDVEGLPFVEYSDLSPGKPGKAWFNGRGTPRTVITTNAAVGALGAARYGVGYAACPVPLGRAFGLRQVSPSVETYYVFVVIHPDMRRSPRVRAVADFIYQFCDERSDVFG